jgi:hypothetical protein
MLRDGSRGNPLVIHEDGNREIYVEGLSEFRVRNMDECLALLRIGACVRACVRASPELVAALSVLLSQSILVSNIHHTPTLQGRRTAPSARRT